MLEQRRVEGIETDSIFFMFHSDNLMHDVLMQFCLASCTGLLFIAPWMGKMKNPGLEINTEKFISLTQQSKVKKNMAVSRLHHRLHSYECESSEMSKSASNY